jgi:hypothetical protein
MTIARGQMKRQLYQDGTMPEGGLPSLEDIMEGKVSPAEMALIRETLEDEDFISMQEGYNLEDEMSDEDTEVMENLRLKQMAPEYQYNEKNPYTGPRPMRMGGGLMDTRQAYGFGSLVKSITKPIKKAVSGIGDVVGDAVKDFDVKDAAKAFVMSGGNPYAAAFAGTSGDEKLGFNPFSFTSGGFGTGQPFSFAPQSGGFPGTGGGFPGTGGGDLGGIADILRLSTVMQTPQDIDREDEKQDIDENDIVEAVLRGMGKGGDTSAGKPSGFDIKELIINQLKKITGKDVAAGAAGAVAAKLSYEDRKRLIEQIQKDIKQQRADVAMFRERFKNLRGTGRATGAPTGPADVVKRPGQAMGGIMDVPLRTNPQGVTEMDFRETGGFVPPVGIKEKADDIPAMLSNNEFVFTADAVRAAGGGSVNKGAERMYSLMKQLEGQV